MSMGSRYYILDIDLNKEPTDSSEDEFDCILDEQKSTYDGQIHDRIRHLVIVIYKAMKYKRWPPIHYPIQITNFTREVTTVDPQYEGRENQEVGKGIVKSGEKGKKKGAHLIAKALEMKETDANKAGSSTGMVLYCHTCLGIARDPVGTRCGHLFCGPCFYQLLYAYANAKECPICKGELTIKDFIPNDTPSPLELGEIGSS